MKKLSISYYIVVSLFAVTTFIFFFISQKFDWLFFAIHFFAFLYIYEVISMHKYDELSSKFNKYYSDTREWKINARDAHFTEVSDLTSQLDALKSAHSQECVSIKKQSEQALESMKQKHEAETSNLKQAHLAEMNNLKQSHLAEIRSINQNHENEVILLRKSLREESEKFLQLQKAVDSSLGFADSSQFGVINRLQEAERIISDSIDSMDGIVYERYVGYKLKTEGWKSIEFTKASGDYGADIIGIDNEGVRSCVQCKRYKDTNTVGIKAVQEAVGGRTYYDCDRAYVCSPYGVSQEAWLFANKAGVIIKPIK